MNQNNLVEKLSLQVESFQEGFEILSSSSNFKEMAMNFARLLRGNFLIKEINIFYKLPKDPEWKGTRPDNGSNHTGSLYLTDGGKLKIIYPSDEKINAAVVLPLSDSSCLGIILGKKIDGTVFNDYDKISLQILLQLFDNAHRSFLDQIKEKQLIFNLNEKVSQLNNLIDTGIELSRYDKRNHLFEFALERASSLTNSESAFLGINGAGKTDLEKYYTFPLGIHPERILKNEFKIESIFIYRNKSYHLALSGKETRKGLTAFNELDKLLLDAIARQLSASIENEYLHLQSLEKERIDQELNVAAAIQKRIIPERLSDIRGYDIAGINIPSREVGGDYYDIIKMENGKVAVVIADVAGKGISAALLVNTLHAALYSYMGNNAPLSDIFSKLNKLIYNSSPSDKYITCFTAILDPETGALEIVNAGHNPILLLREDNTILKIGAGGTGLGMLDFNIPFQDEKLTLNSGEKLFLYTDGIPEAMNENEEEYSETRMINFLKNFSGSSAEKLIEALVEDVKLFVKDAPQSDDITALMLKRI